MKYTNISTTLSSCAYKRYKNQSSVFESAFLQTYVCQSDAKIMVWDLKKIDTIFCFRKRQYTESVG